MSRGVRGRLRNGGGLRATRAREVVFNDCTGLRYSASLELHLLANTSVVLKITSGDWIQNEFAGSSV